MSDKVRQNQMKTMVYFTIKNVRCTKMLQIKLGNVTVIKFFTRHDLLMLLVY